MEFNDKTFQDVYFKYDAKKNLDKLKDEFQSRNQKIFPFTQNPSANLYDGKCGLNGVAAEFYRILTKSTVKPICSSVQAESDLREALSNRYNMAEDDIERFIQLFNDILFDNGMLNIIDTSFYAFVPMKFHSATAKETKNDYPTQDNYRSGQNKIARYYASLSECCQTNYDLTPKDLFSEIIYECLKANETFYTKKNVENYYILPFVKQQFASDLNWLMNQSKDAIVKYFPLFLHFYLCYSLMQILVFLNDKNWDCDITKPKEVYFMLSSEKVTKMADCVRKGWSASDCVPEPFLNRLSAYAQTLDILNCLFAENENLLMFQDIFKLFENMSFDSHAKATCENVLREYQTRKNNTLSDRGTEQKSFNADTSDTSVNSFKEFVDKLLKLCIALQSKDYTRLKRPIHDLFKINLRLQRKDYKVLALDDDMLLLVIAMAVGKDKRIRMDELYSRIQKKYGILFSYQTRNEIADYLQNLNLLERKSDSGEAQYVHVIL